MDGYGRVSWAIRQRAINRKRTAGIVRKLESMKRRFQTEEAETKRLRGRLQHWDGLLATARENEDKAKKLMNESKEKEWQLADAVMTWRQLFDDERNRANLLEVELTGLNQQLALAEDTLGQRDTRRDQLQQRINDAENFIQELRAQAAQRNAQIEDLKGRLNGATIKAEVLEEQKEELEYELEEVKTKLTQALTQEEETPQEIAGEEEAQEEQNNGSNGMLGSESSPIEIDSDDDDDKGDDDNDYSSDDTDDDDDDEDYVEITQVKVGPKKRGRPKGPPKPPKEPSGRKRGRPRKNAA